MVSMGLGRETLFGVAENLLANDFVSQQPYMLNATTQGLRFSSQDSPFKIPETDRSSCCRGRNDQLFHGSGCWTTSFSVLGCRAKKDAVGFFGPTAFDSDCHRPIEIE